MKTKTIGIALIIIGIIMMIYLGFNYFTKEKVVEIGSLELNVDKKHHVQWPPLAGAIILVGGIVVFLMSKKEHIKT